jgi:HSP20 family protein
MKVKEKAKELIPWSSARREVSQRRNQGTTSVRNLQTDINRAFEDFWSGMELPMLGRMQTDLDIPLPNVDVSESDNEVEIVAELPGMKEDDVEVLISDGAVTIRGEKQDEREQRDRGFLVHERTFGQFERVIPLPEGLDLDAAKASFSNAVLRINIPKTEEARESVKRISVRRE